MITLTTVFDDRFKYQGRVVNVNMAFDNILRLFEMFDDESLFEHEKFYIGLEMLTDLDEKDIYHMEFDKISALFKYVMKEFLGIDLEPKEGQAEGETPTKFMDWKKDAELIYASFFAVYRMDLFEMHGKLHWDKFQALVAHLDDNSPLKQVIGYRTMKLPSEKEAGKDYVQHVRKMKEVYSLEEQTPEKVDQKLRGFTDILRGGAK